MSVASVCLHECMVCVVCFLCVYAYVFLYKKMCASDKCAHHVSAYECLYLSNYLSVVFVFCNVMYNLVKFLKVLFPLILLFYR